MPWTPVFLTGASLSVLGTGFITLKFYRDWHLRVSSVRWLFFFFFLDLCVFAAARCVYYVWFLSISREALMSEVDNSDDDLLNDPLPYKELDRLGIHAVLHLHISRNPWLTTILIIGDTAHFGVAFWMLPLVHELSQLASKSMDSGAATESKKIRHYALAGHLTIGVFLVIEIGFAVGLGGYTVYTHAMLLATYAFQIGTLVYMIALLVLLKVRGREIETIHGKFITSPVYKRLTHIVLVYAVCALQFHISSIITYASSSNQSDGFFEYIGVSLALYNCTGFALACVTGCSQTCMLRLCSHWLPKDIEAQLDLPLTTSAGVVVAGTSGGLGDATLVPDLDSDVVPLVNPVFVYTDIESSSALWAIGDGKLMQAATDIHDTILRSLLAKYRGYEITTAGDSFQLSFHTIREAVGYCLDVQLALLRASWPKELEGLVPATRTQRVRWRVIFCGLRVRMGVHDAKPSDGTLAHVVHAVTGKIAYIGASEVIANEVGDLGAGGQILVTKRVAEWLMTMQMDHYAPLGMKYEVERVGVHEIRPMGAWLELFQVLPLALTRRKQFFPSLSLPRPPSRRALINNRRLRPTVSNLHNTSSLDPTCFRSHHHNLHHPLRTSSRRTMHLDVVDQETITDDLTSRTLPW